MSFFYWKEKRVDTKERQDMASQGGNWAEKYRKKRYLICGFVVLLIVCCWLFRYIESADSFKQKALNIYHITPYDRIDTVAGNVSSTDTKLAGLYAKYAVLMDATNRRVLFEKEADKEVPMASTTKIMTLLVVLENAYLDDVVTVSDYAATMPDVQLNMKAGEQYRLNDLLYSLMLESHNDTAVAIAEHVGGSVEEFAVMMNEKAKEIGAYHTNFVTPNGLDADGHYTTAQDLALIASYAIENESFLKIVQTQTYTFHEQTTGKSITVNNKDKFLSLYEGAIGIKTGFTGDAGYCFVGAVNRDGKKLVSVVLACGWPPNKGYKWKDTTTLMNYGVKEYDLKEIVTQGTSFQQISVTDSIEGGSITPYVDESVALLLRKDETVDFDIKLPKVLAAPIKKNDTVGEITIYINDEKYKVLPLYSKEEKSKITYEYIFRKICRQYFLVFTG